MPAGLLRRSNHKTEWTNVILSDGCLLFIEEVDMFGYCCINGSKDVWPLVQYLNRITHFFKCSLKLFKQCSQSRY